MLETLDPLIHPLNIIWAPPVNWAHPGTMETEDQGSQSWYVVTLTTGYRDNAEEEGISYSVKSSREATQSYF